jgi:O-antigen/teichoic acid export membrane protein
MWLYAWPFAAWGVFTWAQLASDRWALQAFTSTAMVGRYAVLYQVGYYPLTLLSGLLMQLAVPILFSRAGDASQPERLAHTRQLNQFLVVATIGITLVVSIAAVFLHDWIFSILVAPSFRDVSYLLPLMVLTGGLFALGQTGSLLFLTGTTTHRLVSPKVATAVLAVALMIAGAKTWGLVGVVGAGIAHTLVYAIWVLCLWQSVVPVTPPSRDAAYIREV